MPFIKNTDIQWNKILKASSYDLYHLPGFAAIEAELLGGEAVAWHVDCDHTSLLIPFIKRPVAASGYYDLVSPYGYPGILSTQTIQAAAIADILHQFHKEAVEQQYISSFIRLNPMLNAWQLPKRINGTGEEIYRQWYHGGTVSVDLKSDLETIRNAFSQNHGRNLRRLTKLQYQAHLNNWELMDDFIAAYRQTMKRRVAHPYYFFPQSYFQRLKELLGESLLFITVSNQSGSFVAGGLFTLFSGVMQYHLGATTSEALHLSPSKLMMDKAIQYGLANKANVLHLGGGLGGSTSDGLYRFKKGFGRQYHPYSSLRFIHLPAVYDKLRAHKAKTSSHHIDYFPEYR